LGEGQRRGWVWWCLCLAFWKQAVGLIWVPGLPSIN
jgi:hypothetical protein